MGLFASSIYHMLIGRIQSEFHLNLQLCNLHPHNFVLHRLRYVCETIEEAGEVGGLLLRPYFFD